MRRAALLGAALVAASAPAHSKGFHKRDVLTVTARAVEALVTLDIDSGKRCQLLRSAADADGDGQLSGAELKALRAKLVALAVRPLKAEISGYPLTWVEGESKLDARGDFRASEAGLSVAVLLRAEVPGAVTSGMSLVVSDGSPDHSHIAVEVYQAAGEDGGAEEAPVRRELAPSEQVKVRLGRLSDVVRN